MFCLYHVSNYLEGKKKAFSILKEQSKKKKQSFRKRAKAF